MIILRYQSKRAQFHPDKNCHVKETHNTLNFYCPFRHIISIFVQARQKMRF